MQTQRISNEAPIGQDEASSVVYGMPKAAYNMGAVEVQAFLKNIHKHILSAMKE